MLVLSERSRNYEHKIAKRRELTVIGVQRFKGDL